MASLQGLDPFQRLSLTSPFPVREQLGFSKGRPFQNEPKKPWGETTMNPARSHLYHDLVLAVDGMDVRDSVLPEVHADHDSEEARDLRHAGEYGTRTG
jgi:hypothetical protein